MRRCLGSRDCRASRDVVRVAKKCVIFCFCVTISTYLIHIHICICLCRYKGTRARGSYALVALCQVLAFAKEKENKVCHQN